METNTVIRKTLTAALILALAVMCSPVLPAADDALKADEGRFRVDGYFSTSYILRTTRSSGDSFTDNDFFERIRIDVTMPGDNRYEFHFFGTVNVDADGNQDWQAFYPLEDVDDTTGSRAAVYVYDAHVGFNQLTQYMKQLRVGRQTSVRDTAVFFDGVAGDFELPRGVNLSVYGGRAVHLYEENPGSDALVGAGVDYSPVPRTKFSVDYLYTDDERDLFPDEQNDLISFKVRQRIGSFSRAVLKYRIIDGEERDVRLRATSSIPDIDLLLSVGYFRQLQDQRELTNEFSLFHDVMGVSHPYQNLDLNIRKLIGGHHAVSVGFAARQLLDSSDESSFNREYNRAFVTYEVYDLVRDDMTVAVTGERWRGGSDIDSLGLDVEYDLNSWRDGAKVSAGTYYSLYKYDYYFDPGEKLDIRTYYIKGRVPLRDNLTGNLTYEYEDADDNYHVVKAELKYAF